MIEAVDAFVKQHELIRRSSTIVVGVSGGPDSMALLDYFIKKKDEMDLTLIVAHVDHMFRGQQSEEDAAFVEDYCKSHDITIASVKKNVPLYIKETGESPQQAARNVRYTHFKSVMIQYGAEYLALGHHGDDQIETMLMGMVRGTEGSGITGIPVQRSFHAGKVIRPFLGITKEEIVHYCKDAKIPYRIDPSNDSQAYTRNRYRTHVLPFLKEENRDVHRKFQRLSERLTEDEKLLQSICENEMDSVILQKCDKRMTLSVERFLGLANPLQRRGIHLILNYLYRTNPAIISYTHIEDCIKLIESLNPSGSINLPRGLLVQRSYDKCLFSFEKKREHSGYTYSLKPGQVLDLPVGNLSMHADSNIHMMKGKDTFFFQPSQIQWPLVVRTRRDGDRIRPKGMQGSRKVKDIFIDAKLTKELRDVWPIVEDGSGMIVWIPLMKHAELSNADRHDQEKLALHFENYKHQV
ncbi:tRNA lysidine(34) synthetase TilS [Alkalihalobacillus sp. AL-G]|uniref:tRNA lysidine(34) synthetase TilS n=1 Tax=Alkalihalobacillus sp. AL-G TaxID=2926399 RepID=UPI00272B71AD|nr:tRNA lysidine(34) synthetase TilS [Alkalihalobacillus sp. AL-G]WLD93478.1 tRNA lysidine(34) synthetase TilS [Alkalihalobacillus sp. AL-G]